MVRQGYQHVRNALKDWCEYYHQELDRLGFPEETPEYKLYATGVRKNEYQEFNTEGVYVGIPWMSQRETKLPGRNFTPTKIRGWGSARLRKIGIAVHNLPVRDQKIVYAVFHPERGKDIKNSDFCDVFGVSIATLNRRIRSIYQNISRMLGIVLD